MDIYDIWVDLKPGVRDTQFAEAIGGFLGALTAKGRIEGWRLARRKLGLGPASLGEFHIRIEVRDLAQLDQAFRDVSERADPTEQVHHAVNSLVTNFQAGLSRDFPDAHRHSGEERF
jgi:hypothetical protein